LTERRTIWIADRHRDDGTRLVAHSDKKTGGILAPQVGNSGCDEFVLDEQVGFSENLFCQTDSNQT
jgi:hypothetical protein